MQPLAAVKHRSAMQQILMCLELGLVTAPVGSFVLQVLYVAKQKLIRYMLLKTLTSWMGPILAMWRFSKTNGITEGYHNKMEMMSRRAYGFRNFENYRLRVRGRCGWDGIINRVR